MRGFDHLPPASPLGACRAAHGCGKPGCPGRSEPTAGHNRGSASAATRMVNTGRVAITAQS
eukprot:3190597-Alexandrium_andersonii.AAC.1